MVGIFPEAGSDPARKKRERLTMKETEQVTGGQTTQDAGKKALRGSLLLVLGAMIWGAAFTAQRAGMDHLGPFSFSAIRMLLGGIVMIPVAAWTEKKRKAAGPEGAAAPGTETAKTARTGRLSLWNRLSTQQKAGLLCGLFLFAANSLQQQGLVYTSAGKAGFLTALYVVLVPVAGVVLFGKRTGWPVWTGVAMAVVALFLLCVPAEGFRLEGGDLLVIGCAVCFTGQILCVDHYAPYVNGAALARDEFLVTGLLSLPVALLTETITWEGIRGAMIPILYTGILSCAVGYTLQIIGQRDVNPTVASLLMCLESVFAVLTGTLVLGERMTVREGIGCVLMLSAVILAQLGPRIMERRKTGREKD